MSFLPLTLGVGQASGAGSSGAKLPSKAEVEQVFKRDDYACRFCGFRSLQYQRTVRMPDGLVTACGFCEQVKVLDRVGVTGGGTLIWLPEISQAELNHVIRAIYVARSDAGATADAASRALDALMARRTDAKKRLGSDDPLLLATILHENIKEDELEAAVTRLDGIRFVPLDRYIVRGKEGDINGFPQIVKFWKSPKGPFAKLPAESWQPLFAKLAA